MSERLDGGDKEWINAVASGDGLDNLLSVGRAQRVIDTIEALGAEVERLNDERKKYLDAMNAFYATLKKYGYETSNELVDRNIELEAKLARLVEGLESLVNYCADHPAEPGMVGTDAIMLLINQARKEGE